jgi:hypothetical protein
MVITREKKPLCRLLGRFFSRCDAALSAALSVTWSLLLKMRRRFVGCSVGHYAPLGYSVARFIALIKEKKPG